MVVAEFVAGHPLAFHLIIIVASLLVLIKASDMALLGITEYAKKLGLSDYLIGLIIISLGASMPELVSSVMGAIADDTGVILGTILGSNITGITIVLGISALVAKKLDLNPKVLEKTELMTLFTVALPFALLLDGLLSRLDSGILIGVYIIYLVIVWRKEGQMGKVKKEVKLERIYKDGIIFILALLAILLSARWLVFSSIEIASLMNISSYLIALIVIGIGTSLPDLIVGLRSLTRGHKGIGIGNSLGSIVVKSLLFLGIIGMINPIRVAPITIIGAEAVLLGSLAFILYLTMRKKMTWKHGIILLATYGVFIAVTLVLR